MSTRIEYGVICDRRDYGLGQTMLVTRLTRRSAEIHATVMCTFKPPHPHRIASRAITTSDWGDLDVITAGEDQP